MPGRLVFFACRVAAAGAALAFGLSAAAAPNPPATSRTELQRHDLGVPGREAVQVRVDFPPGGVVPRHTHPGDEIVYDLKGSIEYRFDGKPSVTLKPGGVLFIPAGEVHSARNAGADGAAELSTYVVEKGKPLVIPAK